MLATALSASLSPALARDSDWTIKTGQGEEIAIRNGLFGGKSKVVKDRLGNKYETKKGFFGSNKTDVQVLGNTYKKKKGIFGSSKSETSTIFGDKVSTKKGLFGRRSTTIDLSGSANILQGFVNSKTKQAAVPATPN